MHTDCSGAFKGVHLSPLGFAACQSKKCTNQANSALCLYFVVLTTLHAVFCCGVLPRISQMHTDGSGA